MKTNHGMVTFLCAITLSLQAQDSTLITAEPPEKPHELGVSVLAPVVMLAGR
jgi:hypothetical protein